MTDLPADEPNWCQCGCGEVAAPGRRFIQRHNWELARAAGASKKLARLAADPALPADVRAALRSKLEGPTPAREGE